MAKQLLIAVVLCSALFAQPDEILSQVGTDVITGAEFAKRYESTPLFGQKDKKDGANKLKFLYSMIAERLWSQEAVRRGLDTALPLLVAAESTEKMFARDALYRDVVRKKVTISRSDMQEALLRQSKTLYLNFLFSTDSAEIKDLYNLLRVGIPFDSVLHESPEAAEQKEPVEVVFGQMEKYIEDAVYNCATGQFTSPINTPDGWYIFKLVNFIKANQAPLIPEDEGYKKAEKTVRARKETELYRSYFAKFFQGKKYEANAPLLKMLAVRLASVMQAKRLSSALPAEEKLALESADVIAVQNMLPPDSAAMPLLQIGTDSVSVHKFLLTLAFDGFSVVSTTPPEVYKQLSSRVGSFIQLELLAREAMRLKLHKLPEVVADINAWKVNYRAQYLRAMFTDSAVVSEEELRGIYEKNFSSVQYPAQVNIIEVLSDSLSTSLDVLYRINNGEDIRVLAAKVTKRKETRGRGGEFGFFPVTMYGEIGKVCASLDSGALYGPLKLPEGYSVFKVIGKRKAFAEAPSKTYEEARQGLLDAVAYGKMKKAIDSFTARLALQANFTIDVDVLNTLETTTINSIIFRRLGFGGQVTAVPLLPPDLDWLEEYFIQKNINP